MSRSLSSVSTLVLNALQTWRFCAYRARIEDISLFRTAQANTSLVERSPYFVLGYDAHGERLHRTMFRAVRSVGDLYRRPSHAQHTVRDSCRRGFPHQGS